MAEHLRDVVTGPMTPEYLERRRQEGWTLMALEWVREGDVAGPSTFEVPYGFRVGPDCLHLEQHPQEFAVLALIMEQVVKERSAPQIADELNLRGYTTRRGNRWTASAVFNLLPQLVHAGPGILSSADWPQRRVLQKKVS